MIYHLNILLRKLFKKQLQLRTEQIGFEPPDEAWRSYVDGLDPKIGINTYLVDLRENHSLRSNEQRRTTRNGSVVEMPALRWADCHYLITAWDRSTPAIAQGVEPTLVEHGLLYSIMGLLLDIETQPLTPRQVFAPDPLPPGFPAALSEANLPTSILPGEGFPKLAEFWGTMGAGSRWKPAVYLVVTLPVITERETSPWMVTTVVTKYRQVREDVPEIHITIGGRVLDKQHPLPNGNPAPVVEANVHLETTGGELVQATKTDEQGNFTFTGLQPGSYQLRIQTRDLGEKSRPVDIQMEANQSEVHKYDVEF